MSRFSRLPTTLAHSSRVFSLALIAMLAIALVPLFPAQPVAAASGPAQISKFSCPDGFDAAAATFDDLGTNCTDAGVDVTFTLLPDGGVGSDATTDNSGVTFWDPLDPGSGTITEQDAALIGSRVFCSVYSQDALPGAYNEFPAAGNAIGYDLADTEALQCLWYNYSTAVVLQGSEIKLQKWVCPSDYDAEAAASLDELWSNCTDPGVGFPFSRLPDGGDPAVDLQTDAGGAILWPEFPSGTGNVTETAAENNLSRVFCTYYDIGAIGIALYTEYSAVGNQIAYDLTIGQGLDCEWFNYSPPFETSDVFIYKLACPEGDWTESTLDDLTLECVDPHTDVPFQISSPSTGFEDVTDAGGFVGWGVASGDTYTVTETTPAGYGTARVFCSYYDQNVGPGEYLEVDAPGNTIETTLDVGFSLECYWFNLPAQLGTFVVDKYECPQGYGAGTSYDQLVNACTVPVTGVTFTLTPAVDPAVEGQTDGSGRVVLADVPLGEGTLDELVPQQYNYVEVYCAISDDVASGPYQQQFITAQNVMGYLMEPTQIWNCSWFNLTLEAGPASLTINKYTCQSAHDPVEPNQTLLNECAEPTEDINFTLAGESGPLSASTGEGGAPATIQFSELEPGSYLLTEEIPDNVRLAYVTTCTSDVRTFSSPLSPFTVVEPEGRVNVELLPGEDLECDWYNVLQDLPGTLTIIKYWCQGNIVNAESCDLYDGGVAFTLISQAGGEDIALVTGEDGTATSEAEGVYEIVEEDFDWCSAQSDAADASGNIVVEAGTQVTVEIFNCGPVPLQGGS